MIEKVEFEIRGDYESYRVKHAVSVEDLDLPCQSLPSSVASAVKSAENVTLRAYEKARARILLGQDQWQIISTRELRELENFGFGISRSLLGWSIHGPASQTRLIRAISDLSTVSLTVNVNACTTKKGDEVDRLDDLVKQYFQLDSLGPCEFGKVKSGNEYTLLTLKNTTKRVNKSWETGLLWKKGPAPNVDSMNTARKRLVTLERRLDRDSGYASLYYREMNRLIKNGYAEKVNREASGGRVWYLPHFGVFNENKPGKVRLVFDAAAKSAGVSLNDQVDAGPDLLQSLPGVIVRFREHPIAVKADIKGMFLRVMIRKEDRGAQRFLWRGRARNVEPEQFEMTCLIFGARASPCSAMYVKNENARSFTQSKPDASRTIIKNSYMDDFLASRRTVGEAADLVNDVIKINTAANFEMHEWASNEADALPGRANLSRSKNNKEGQLCNRGNERVLGLFWDTQSDELGFNVGLSKIPDGLLTGSKIPTKREFLRVVMSVFDPLGFLSPFILKSKILMQDIWRSGVGWDNPLREDEHVGWLSWVKHLREIHELRVPRCISLIGSRPTKADLHVFCDASLRAYSAAAYVRFDMENGPAHIALIMAKTRVAPSKPLSVPRLELLAALLGSRLANTLKKEFEIQINRRVFWSDSITVIRWIRSEPRLRQIFVAHRSSEIGDLTESSEWRWVPSSLNPADDATRWSSETLRSDQRWFVGPDYLCELEGNWPVERPLKEKEKQAIDGMEVRKTCVYVTSAKTLDLPVVMKALGWRGLLVVARRVRAAFDRWRGNPRFEMTPEVVSDAELYWYRIIQNECFAEELAVLRSGKPLKRSSKIASLDPFVDERGVLRATGRITRVPDAEFCNEPIILDGRHPATKLLIAEYHRRYYHASNDTVVNEIRQRYYVLGLRNGLRSLISRCIVCRLRRAKPCNPMMSALHPGRIAYRQRPFSHCGVDYFGPMQVKVGRRREKRWGVMFTCLTTRAIHLEMAHGLSADSAIMALQRLAARRGAPIVMYSDNGTNFKGASKELKTAIAQIDRKKQVGYATTRQIKWVFNPPDAPHMGGIWERMIRSVKVALSAVLREQAPSEEVLSTLLTEVEHFVNSRPLTHVPVDARDNEALTSNHFLIGTSSGEVRLERYCIKDTCPRMQYRIGQRFAEAFWRRWLREYLPTLMPRQKWLDKETPLSIGDLVLIMDLQAPRNTWKRGTITAMFPGLDGQVRVARVCSRNSEFVRPTRKLIKLLGAKEVQNS